MLTRPTACTLAQTGQIRCQESEGLRAHRQEDCADVSALCQATHSLICREHSQTQPCGDSQGAVHVLFVCMCVCVLAVLVCVRVNCGVLLQCQVGGS